MCANRLNVNSLIILLLLLCSSWAQAQEIKVSGKFLADSIKIGEPVAYSLTAKYPQHLSVLFPDSTFQFFPFEFTRKLFFSTKTTNGISYDSTVYYFTSFELDEIQKLSLPAFVLSVRDCTVIAADPDSVFLVGLAEIPPDSLSAQNLPLKTNVLYEDVWNQFNYIIVVIVLLALTIVSIIIWIIFGKKIIKYFKLRKIIKKHQEFIQSFKLSLEQLNNAHTPKMTEKTMLLWKKYMEYLEQKPYTKLTTKETISITPDESLGEQLKNIDGAIYGHNQNVVQAFEYLMQFSETQFQKRLDEIKHG